MSAHDERRGHDDLVALIDAHGHDLPLDEAAIAVAVDEDEQCVPDAVRQDLDTLADATHLSGGTDPGRVLAHLNTLLFRRLGFTGDTETYHHVDNSLIHRVIARRKGMPLTLCLLYAEVARRLGVTLHGTGFPAHFVLRPAHAKEPVFIDVFHGGRLLDESMLSGMFDQLYPGAEISQRAWNGLIAPIDNKAFIARLVRNLKVSRAQEGDAQGVLRAADRLLLLEPAPIEHRDRGLALAELGRREEAKDALAEYLANEPDAEDARAIALRLSAL